MPVRNFVVGLLAEKIRGVHLFKYGEGSETITDTQLRHARNTAEDAFLWFVQQIDWSRIHVEAGLICHKRERFEGHKAPFGDNTCGECLKLALLADDRNWLDKPDPDTGSDFTLPDLDEYAKILDWPLEIAKCINYRTDRTFRLMRQTRRGEDDGRKDW